ncbi:hybrid sensor histidine kinase/response regulator transcription factor [Dyadobacter psychrophilus]|nr:hybrid sensor histidine kinase/response regulator transcription factor [Dyadobacter psychrophilus]
MARLFLMLIFVSISTVGVAFCQPFPYKFNYLTVDEGLSHTDVNDIVQDDKGYIWLATNFGLDRYDGYAIRKFYNSNVPLNNAFKNRVIKLFPGDDGKIWLSTEGGLQCFNPKTETFTDFSMGKNTLTPVFWNFFKPAGDLIYGYLNYTFKVFKINGNRLEEQKVSLPDGVRFFDMKPDRKGIVYFASDKGVWRLDGQRKIVQVPINGLPDRDLSGVFFDDQNNLLVAAANNVFVVRQKQLGNIGKQGDLFVDKQVAVQGASIVHQISVAKNGDYWINTRSGLTRLDHQLNFVQTIHEKSAPNSLNSSTSLSSFIDRSNCLWVGTSGGGVNYCDLNQKLFYTIQHVPGQVNSLSGNHIRSVLEDGDNLWIGTNANGLNLYNLKTQRFSFYNTYNTPVKLKHDEVTALTFDNDHNLWIGSNAGIDILKPDKKTLWKPLGYDQFPRMNITTLARDCFGNIWFGNLDKLGVIWKDGSGRYCVKMYAEGHFILPDQTKPQLLVSSRQGLKQLLIDKEGNITKAFYYKVSAKRGALSSDYITAISRQNDSTYWVGTIGGALNRFSLSARDNAHTFRSYGAGYGIFYDVESIETDGAGNIWMGGDGLERLDLASGKVIRYDKNDGLQGNSFKIRASYKGADGRLYFGGINGLNYFYPQQIKANGIGAKPILTDILINNKRPVYAAGDSLQNALNGAIGYGNELRLNYLQNNFVIAFSAMHFANPMKCQYRYKLIGFDEDWNYTDGKRPAAAYSNLDYKGYRLIVEATNNDGIWSKNRAKIAIVVTPPWWKSDLAKFVYALLILSAISGIYIYQARWYRLKREMEVRRVNEKKREEIHTQREALYQQQLAFFTNISHEFRTPLTLILGPLENLISQNQSAVLDNSYQLMLRNAKRLFNLISELMNFRKVADSMIKLQVQRLKINPFCRDLITEFENVADSKDIDLQFIDHTENQADSPLAGLFDVHIIEKILLNLLNNSFKYTERGGQVCFEIFTDIRHFKPSFDAGFELLNESHRAEKYLYFRVADSGIGISSETITHIFDRYYRISRDHLGSGIGLALVKSLTQLHKGDIYVYSERNKGTEIIIGIPLGDENYSEAEKATSETGPEVRLETVDHSVLTPMTEASNERNSVQSSANKRILIVDDNEELGTFLRQAFEKNYFIYQAEDGKTALEIAIEKVPDLIISDVMMPVMNGIELCKAVKERFETSHIPFIILSAKDALATKIKGMESGADYYFAKPLSIDLLLLTVHNIFEQSAKLKARFTNNYLAEATELVHSEKDKSFFQTLLILIEDNIEDPELDVDFLCKHLYISRTKLYQKIKSITDQSVGDFIRTVRLKKAIQIMTHEDIPLSKVVERIGLQSSSSFSKIFKKEYGKSPLQFMQSLRQNADSKTDLNTPLTNN